MVEDRSPKTDSRQVDWVLRAANILRGGAMLGVLLVGGLWAASLHNSSRTRDETTAPVSVPKSSEGLDSLSAVRSSWTFYVVGSEDEAVALRDVLEQGNNIRNSVGLAPLFERVFVATGPAEAQVIVEQLIEGNTILAAFGAADQVVNLGG